MQEPHLGARKGKLEVFLAHYGYDAPVTDLNKNYSRLNETQTNYIRNYINEISYKESQEIEENDKKADEIEQRRAKEQSQFGNSFLNRNDNATRFESTMIAAAHEENDNFYRTMTGLEPPKK